MVFMCALKNEGGNAAVEFALGPGTAEMIGRNQRTPLEDGTAAVRSSNEEA